MFDFYGEEYGMYYSCLMCLYGPFRKELSQKVKASDEEIQRLKDRNEELERSRGRY